VTLRKPSAESLSLPDSFLSYLKANGKADEILDSPNMLARTVKEYEEWKRRDSS